MGTTDPNAWISRARCPVSGAALRPTLVGGDVFMLASRSSEAGRHWLLLKAETVPNRAVSTDEAPRLEQRAWQMPRSTWHAARSACTSRLIEGSEEIRGQRRVPPPRWFGPGRFLAAWVAFLPASTGAADVVRAVEAPAAGARLAVLAGASASAAPAA
jgi:hypothetical protein